MNQVVALAKGRHAAEHCVAHAEILALARAGRLQAARLSSNRAMATRDGSNVTGRRERCGKAVYGNAAEEKGAPRKR